MKALFLSTILLPAALTATSADLDRERFISDEQMFRILKEHFKEGDKIEAACLECHDPPPANLPALLTPAEPEAETDPALSPREILSTADHRRFVLLRTKFQTGLEVTAACLTCHTEAAKQVMETSHWTWFCTKEDDSNSAFPREARFHSGYEGVDCRKETGVDCLICHDTTGTYERPASATLDLAEIAQLVGKPSPQNCGNCHFAEGRDDLVSTLTAHDVHLARADPPFACGDCHWTQKHQIPGRGMRTADWRQPGLRTCVACHTGAPHHKAKLNHHTTSVACQASHIPMAATYQPRADANSLIWPMQDHWYLSHLVAPEEKALDCEACHHPRERLAKLRGFYLPGRDGGGKLDLFGALLLSACLAATGMHGVLRIYFARKNESTNL